MKEFVIRTYKFSLIFCGAIVSACLFATALSSFGRFQQTPQPVRNPIKSLPSYAHEEAKNARPREAANTSSAGAHMNYIRVNTNDNKVVVTAEASLITNYDRQNYVWVIRFYKSKDYSKPIAAKTYLDQVFTPKKNIKSNPTFEDSFVLDVPPGTYVAEVAVLDVSRIIDPNLLHDQDVMKSCGVTFARKKFVVGPHE